jgi:hypothetical protein
MPAPTAPAAAAAAAAAAAISPVAADAVAALPLQAAPDGARPLVSHLCWHSCLLCTLACSCTAHLRSDPVLVWGCQVCVQQAGLCRPCRLVQEAGLALRPSCDQPATQLPHAPPTPPSTTTLCLQGDDLARQQLQAAQYEIQSVNELKLTLVRALGNVHQQLQESLVAGGVQAGCSGCCAARRSKHAASSLARDHPAGGQQRPMIGDATEAAPAQHPACPASQQD